MAGDVGDVGIAAVVVVLVRVVDHAVPVLHPRRHPRQVVVFDHPEGDQSGAFGGHQPGETGTDGARVLGQACRSRCRCRHTGRALPASRRVKPARRSSRLDRSKTMMRRRSTPASATRSTRASTSSTRGRQLRPARQLTLMPDRVVRAGRAAQPPLGRGVAPHRGLTAPATAERAASSDNGDPKSRRRPPPDPPRPATTRGCHSAPDATRSQGAGTEQRPPARAASASGHGSASPKTCAVKTSNRAPFRQPSGGRPAFRARWSSMVVRSHPCSTATCGRNRARWPPFSRITPCVPTSMALGPGNRKGRRQHRDFDLEAVKFTRPEASETAGPERPTPRPERPRPRAVVRPRSRPYTRGGGPGSPGFLPRWFRVTKAPASASRHAASCGEAYHSAMLPSWRRKLSRLARASATTAAPCRLFKTGRGGTASDSLQAFQLPAKATAA